MGTDIYAYIEDVEIDRYWLKAMVRLERHYALFDMMAGERGGEPVYPARGVPDNVSAEIRKIARAAQARNYSFLTPPEFSGILRMYLAKHQVAAPPTYYATLKFMQQLSGLARLVFWFDG